MILPALADRDPNSVTRGEVRKVLDEVAAGAVGCRSVGRANIHTGMEEREERVVLVDASDTVVGSHGKLGAHEEGLLHRALSVFVFDGRGRLLLQRRATGKYHSGGLWTNTCCSHPRPGEGVVEAAHRRLREEMGFDCPLAPACSFVYRAELDNGLIEHELDHVLVGRFDGEPRPDPLEADGWRWAALAEVEADLASSPGRYSAWLPAALAELRARHLLPPSG